MKLMVFQLPEDPAANREACREFAAALEEHLAGDPCPVCGQTDHGQTGEYPCPKCGLPTTWDDQEKEDGQ